MIKIENDKLIVSANGHEYSFPAEAEKARPSLAGIGVSVGGIHLSNRDPNIKIEKHCSIQQVKVGDKYVAWYIQEFVPNGIDYKLTKNARIYLGYFNTNEHKLIYKGECYGDLYFYENELFFNTGNKLAVYNIDTEEISILFKHSGIKKNGLGLHITKERIFYTHWTHSSSNFMWFDRRNKELVNPHISSNRIFYINDEEILYNGVSQTWILDVTNRKKTQLFSNKKSKEICKEIYNILGIPIGSHELGIEMDLENYDGERLFFFGAPYYIENGKKLWIDKKEALEKGYPPIDYVRFSCLMDGTKICLKKDKDN